MSHLSQVLWQGKEVAKFVVGLALSGEIGFLIRLDEVVTMCHREGLEAVIFDFTEVIDLDSTTSGLLRSRVAELSRLGCTALAITDDEDVLGSAQLESCFFIIRKDTLETLTIAA